MPDASDAFCFELFDVLWRRYRERVPYARTYERAVKDAGGDFVNDHVAFRTFATGRPFAGIGSVSRIFEALGYIQAGCYVFPDKNLDSIHYRHPNPRLPKLFVSELKTWELSGAGRRIVARSVREQRAPLPDETLAALRGLKEGGAAKAKLLRAVTRHLWELPWDAPRRDDVEALNRESQFGAWVLVHGYEVNHFTASVDDIEKSVDALRRAGVPMKAEIEGERGSKLRQSATEAVVIDVAVRDGARRTKMPWTYAYFELAERNGGFEGFLGGQATHLFEMTRLKKAG